MPIFMDCHEGPGRGPVPLDEIVGLHRLDLEAQEAFDVRFLAFWLDPVTGGGWCLAEAPNAEAMRQVHAVAHGMMPAEIIEVDVDEVAAFLGRASEPDLEEWGTVGFQPDSALRTIVFTDMTDSTTMTFTFGEEEALELLEQHDWVVTSTVSEHKGRIVKHTGDGFLISFGDVEEALRAMIRIQRDVSALDDRLSIRVGINPGNPVERDEDLFGLAIQVASRICDQAEPGQILASGIVRELCSDPSLADRLIEHDRILVKGAEAWIQVYELDWR